MSQPTLSLPLDQMISSAVISVISCNHPNFSASTSRGPVVFPRLPMYGMHAMPACQMPAVHIQKSPSPNDRDRPFLCLAIHAACSED